MLTKTERAWLAGFLDADGMIRLRIGRKNKCKWKNVAPKSLVPIVLYTNTCQVTMKRLAELIGKGFTDFRATMVRSPRMTENNWRAKVTIEIGGISRVEPFLLMLRPYLVTKAAEADLAIRFCEIRRERGRGRYEAVEYQIFEALKLLKQTRHLRDYTPSVEEILSEDIVRTNAKTLEMAEMAIRQTDEERREWARNLVSRYRWNPGRKSNSTDS